jgi:hypothetical protein
MTRLWTSDEEMEPPDWRFSLFESPEAARAEAEFQGLDDPQEAPEGHRQIETCSVLAGTPALEARMHHPRLEAIDCFDFAAIAWAMDTQPDLLGAWWRETYEPDALSAPRGGIFPDKVGRFATFPTQEADLDDEPDALLGPPYVLAADGTLHEVKTKRRPTP